MSKEFINAHSIDGYYPVGFSVDTAKPQMTIMHFGNNQMLRQEHFGINETAEILSDVSELPFGKFELDKFYDEDGDIVDWTVALYPQIDENSLDYIHKSIVSQPSERNAARLEKIYNDAMPLVQITPREGIVMLTPGNSIHLECNRRYVKWSDGSEIDLLGTVANGMTVQARNIPGEYGKFVDLNFECEMSHSPMGIDTIIRKMHEIVLNGEYDCDKLRSFVNVSMTISQIPSDGDPASINKKR